MGSPLLTAASLSKSFGGEAALVDASLTLERGEIRALLGANGSGKSTLVKLLAGYHEPDDTSLPIEVEGEVVHPSRDGGIEGFRFIHQDLGLVPELSVADNLLLGPEVPARLLRPRSTRDELRHAAQLIDRFGVSFAPRTLVRDLSASDRTMVALMRALQDEQGTKVLVLDEVTATLPPRESTQVLDAARNLEHCGVLFVSHRMEEVMQLCHTATVLRSGRVVADVRLDDVDERTLIELLTGRPLSEMYPDVPQPERERVLTLRGATGGAVRSIDLDVHRGELVGVASLDPAESSGLLSLVYGEQGRTAGEILLEGEALAASAGPPELTALGVNLVTDRLVSSIASFRVRENLLIGRASAISGRWRVSGRRERLLAAELIMAFGISPPDQDAIFAGLSGGNQQKAVLARSLRLRPRLLLLDDPTRGVDVGAKAAIYRVLRDAAESGMAILVASTDFDELASLCHRVVVLRGGRLNGVLGGAELSGHRLLEQCYVTTPQAA